MREPELRQVLLVKAVEEADAEATLLPPADRAAAGREAMRRMAPAGTRASDEALLAERARTLLERIVARHPFVERVMALLGPSAGLTVAAIVAGLAVGGALSALDGSRRINVLAFPLLGLVAWNLAVYAAVVMLAMRRGPRRMGPLREAAASAGWRLASRMIARSRGFNKLLADALEKFARQWYEANRTLLAVRAARAFHLAAAAVGVGLVAGLYLRGIAFDYQAGWESTFLDAQGARRLLAVLYGPASAITGIAIPDAAHLEAMRWRANAGGAPAAAWIHLMAATAFIYVIVPRLVLALAAAIAAARLAHSAPAPADLQAYFRTAFAQVEGAVARARAIILPYACELSPGELARLIAWVGATAGGPVDVDAREAVPYGEEDRFLATLQERGSTDLVVLPFHMATTPEAENHGRVIAGARDWIAASRPGARLLVVIEEAGYAARMAGAGGRAEERREAWRRFVESYGVQPSFASFAA